MGQSTLIIVNRGNGFETRQSSLLHVFVRFFGFQGQKKVDRAQSIIVVYSVLGTNQ